MSSGYAKRAKFFFEEGTRDAMLIFGIGTVPGDNGTLDGRVALSNVSYEAHNVRVKFLLANNRYYTHDFYLDAYVDGTEIINHDLTIWNCHESCHTLFTVDGNRMDGEDIDHADLNPFGISHQIGRGDKSRFEIEDFNAFFNTLDF